VDPEAPGEPEAQAEQHEPLFVADGGWLVPTDSARGPWAPDMLHGGAVAALQSRAVEAVPTAGPMRVVRMTVELSRRVPWAPARVRTRVVRDGRRVQLVEATLVTEGDDTPLSTMAALRIREDPGLVPDDLLGEPREADAAPAPPEAATPVELADGPFQYLRSFEVRTLGSWGQLEATTWFRMRAALVAGEATTPLQWLAATADLVMSGSRRLDVRRWISVNADLSVFVERYPSSPWIALTSVVRIDGAGIGSTDGVVHDRTGRIGRAVKSLLLDRR
jgi:hypothetical protein